MAHTKAQALATSHKMERRRPRSAMWHGIKFAHITHGETRMSLIRCHPPGERILDAVLRIPLILCVVMAHILSPLSFITIAIFYVLLSWKSGLWFPP